MKDRPTIFRADSVRAILAGTKTVTRRPPGTSAFEVGMLLWVKETWGVLHEHAGEISFESAMDDIRRGVPWATVIYRADEEPPKVLRHRNGLAIGGWRSPLYLPRALARLELRVLEVRREPLQSITADDAAKEGVLDPRHVWDGNPYYPRARFADAWDAIHGKGAWDANPLVDRVAFEVARKALGPLPRAFEARA
jgi:hypothetical protein